MVEITNWKKNLPLLEHKLAKGSKISRCFTSTVKIRIELSIRSALKQNRIKLKPFKLIDHLIESPCNSWLS